MEQTPAALPLPSTPSSNPPLSVRDQAIELTAPRKFHRIFTLPGASTHGPLKVTYSIAGPDVGEDVPTILFCGGMFGMRWMAITQNWFAEQQGVRLIFIDRPGFGGSTPVPTSQRIPIFLETSVALLAHLRIQHIALASQSAGTIYALNLISHHPELLYPSNPTLTLFSPWVHQSISGKTGLQIASILPDLALNQWNSIVGGVITKGAPTLNFSSGMLSSMTNLFKTPTIKQESKEKRDKKEKECKDRFGVSLEVKDELFKVVNNFIFQGENTTGGNDEAKLCLKAVAGTSWDRCEVYPTFVQELKVVWEERVKQNGKKLRLRIAFGEGEDFMIGRRGMDYFKEQFEQGKCGEGVEVEVVEEKGADHDTIVDPMFGSMKDLFDRVKEGWK